MVGEEILINFGGNHPGASWDNIPASSLNTRTLIPLHEGEGNPTGISLKGFAPIDPKLTAYSSAQIGPPNTGSWNGGAQRDWIPPAAAQDYVAFSSPGVDFVVGITGLDSDAVYKIEFLGAMQFIEISQNFGILRTSSSVDRPDTTANGGGPDVMGVGTQSEGWNAANYVIWNSVSPGITDPQLVAATQLPGDGYLLCAYVHLNLDRPESDTIPGRVNSNVTSGIWYFPGLFGPCPKFYYEALFHPYHRIAR